MKLETYTELFDGFHIKHASIRQKNIIVFVLQQLLPIEQDDKPDEEMPTRVVSYVPQILSAREGFGDVEFPRGIRYGYVVVDDRIVFIEDSGSAWESQSDGSWHQVVTHTDKMRFLTGIKKIGNSIFACGSSRKIYQRQGFQQWVDLVDDTQHDYVYADIVERTKKKISHLGYPMGFRCLGGFNEQDIYAGGSNGSCWRFDGKLWYRVDLQTNTDVADIVCADNGKVYVCLKNGNIIIGRNDHWQRLERKVDEYGFAADVTSAAWFQGKLYLGTPFDLYVFDEAKPSKEHKEGTMSKYKFPEDGPKQSSFGYVAACDEALLSYGNYQALIFDGKSWTEIVNRPVFAHDKPIG